MKNTKWRYLIICILIFMIPLSANATTIDDLKQQQEELKKQQEELKKQQEDIKKEQANTQQMLENANSEVDDLTEVRKGITEEIEAIDDELVDVMTSISLIEDEIVDIEDRIEIAKADLEEAIRIEEEQYETMKLRIKFMYEQGNANNVDMLMGAENMGDMINKAEYVEKLYDYDRTKLEEYIAAKEAVEAAKIALEEQQEELITARYELELEKEALDTLLAEKKEEAEDYDIQIAKARQDAAVYKAQIKQQNAQIRKLEDEARKKAEEEARKKAEEEAKRKEEQALNGEGTSEGEEGTSDSSSTDSSSTDSSSTSSSSSSSSSSAATTISSSSGSVTGKQVANYGCQFIGNPYVAGGTSLTNGADCSGFTMSVYKAFGYNLPRSSTAQRSAGVGVTYAEAQPGDLICYAGHVAIYIGNGQIVHASTPSSGIKIGSATYREILAVRRIVN